MKDLEGMDGISRVGKWRDRHQRFGSRVLQDEGQIL